LDKLVESLKGVGMQGVLAVLLTLTTCFLWSQGRPVPQDLILLNGIVMAFYFGNKTADRRAAEPALAPPSLPEA
jgi:hypothetical protein